MIARTHHLEEERLFDCYLAARAGEPLPPQPAEHLADCSDCAARYADLTRFMDTLEADGAAEADAVFTASFLRTQREQIARRVEQAGQVARVISFPGRFVQRHITSSGGRAAARWTASAAAAGLFVGVALGMFLDRQRSTVPVSTAYTAPAPVPMAAPAAFPEAPRPIVNDYDTFVRELDQARGGPGAPELQPFDQLTPHVHEISISMPLH